MYQDLGKIREELKAKELVKEAEAKRRGMNIPDVITQYLSYLQRRSRMPKLKPLLRPRSKQTRRPEQRRQQGRKRSVKDDQ